MFPPRVRGCAVPGCAAFLWPGGESGWRRGLPLAGSPSLRLCPLSSPLCLRWEQPATPHDPQETRLPGGNGGGGAEGVPRAPPRPGSPGPGTRASAGRGLGDRFPPSLSCVRAGVTETPGPLLVKVSPAVTGVGYDARLRPFRHIGRSPQSLWLSSSATLHPPAKPTHLVLRLTGRTAWRGLGNLRF